MSQRFTPLSQRDMTLDQQRVAQAVATGPRGWLRGPFHALLRSPELADRVRVRHRLVVDVLRALGVPTEAAEADAEGIEHHVSETTLKAFAHFLKR